MLYYPISIEAIFQLFILPRQSLQTHHGLNVAKTLWVLYTAENLTQLLCINFYECKPHRFLSIFVDGEPNQGKKIPRAEWVIIIDIESL
jgi:hypothetical protein